MLHSPTGNGSGKKRQRASTDEIPQEIADFAAPSKRRKKADVPRPRNRVPANRNKRKHTSGPSYFSWLGQIATTATSWAPKIFNFQAITLWANPPLLPIVHAPIQGPSFDEQNQSLLNQVYWAHGGSVSTLVGARFVDNRVFPFGQLMRLTKSHGIVPLAGTFDGGSTLNGVNQKGISGVTATTDYRFSDAWQYATQTKPVVSTDELERIFLQQLNNLAQITPGKVIPEADINKLARQFAQLKALRPQALQVIAESTQKPLAKLFKAVIGNIMRTLDTYQQRMSRLVSLFSNEDALSTFKNNVLEKMSTLTQNDHDNLVGRHRLGFSATPKQFLVDALYLQLRKLRLLYTRKYQSIVENLTHDAHGLHSFGGWPASAMASGLTAREDSVFESELIALLTGYMIQNSGKTLRTSLGYPESYAPNCETYSLATVKGQLAHLQNKLQTHRDYVQACLSLTDNMQKYSEADLALIARNIPVMYCSNKAQPNMRKAKHECSWETAEGIKLGDKNGINILLTDTRDNQQILVQYLQQHNIAGIQVGVYANSMGAAQSNTKAKL